MGGFYVNFLVPRFGIGSEAFVELNDKFLKK